MRYQQLRQQSGCRSPTSSCSPPTKRTALSCRKWLCEIDHFHRSRQARGVERQRIILQRQINQSPKQPSDEIVRGVPAAVASPEFGTSGTVTPSS